MSDRSSFGFWIDGAYIGFVVIVNREERLNKLRGELRDVEERIGETLKKSGDAFNLGGDGWHDNSAYHLMIADVDKLGAMVDQIRQEMKELQQKEGKVIVVHGTGGSRDGNWFPYLDRQLSKLNFRVIRPQFPTPEGQTLSGWFRVWKREVGDVDFKTIFVGHSSAAAFLLRVLEKIKTPLGACFFVAPFVRDNGDEEFDQLNMRFYQGGYDWGRIRRKCRKFFVYVSDDDPYVPLGHSLEVARNLEAKTVLIKGAKHFNAEAGFTKFPQLLNDIKKLVSLKKGRSSELSVDCYSIPI